MKLVIYQTSDLHGFVYPTNYVTEVPLGILKIGSYILEDEKNYEASLKIDCGDLVQGSALTHYLSKQAKETNPIVQGLEAVGYDVYVLGNHEFNYGLDYLKNAYQDVTDKLLNANIEGLPIESKPYKIFEFDGFKIGCIGLTTLYIPNWENENNIKDIKFLDPVEAYGKYEEELKEQCDYIIICYHGGFEKSLDAHMTPTEKLTKENQASELLEKYDSINMILSGHQHRSLITKVKGVLCAQPLNNGQNFTKVVLDTQTKEIAYELVEVSSIHTPICKELESIFEEDEKKLARYLGQTIGYFNKDIKIEDIFVARLQGHPYINFLHEVQLDISKADFSAVALFDTAIGFEKEVSIRDVLVNYPYPNTLKVLKITGYQLKEAIEKSATYFVVKDGKVGVSEGFIVPKKQHYNYDTYGGLTYVIDITRPFYDRVVSMKKEDKEIDLDKEYTIVLSNYRASNTSIYPCYENALLVREINIDMSEILINYFQSHKEVQVIEGSNYVVLYK